MAKSYKVGDTTYQFPDDFDDAKVQGILTEQGVIKSAEAPRDKNELPGYKEAEAWHEAEIRKPPRSASQMLWDAAKQLGSAAVSPITAIPGAVKGVYDWAAGGFHAPAVQSNGRLGPPDYATQPNPATEATAMLSGSALLPAAVEGAKGIPGAAQGAGKAVADVVTSPPVIKGLKRSTEGVVVGSAMHGNLPGMAAGTAGRLAVGGLESWLARRGARASAGAVPTEVSPSAAVPALWDEIAISQAGRKFASLSPTQQAGVQRIAEGMRPDVAAAPPVVETPAPTPGRFSSEEFRSPPPAATPPPEAPVATASTQAAQALRDAMVESGTAPPAGPPTATAVGETMHQLNRTNAASNIAQSLHENGISAAQFQRLRKLNMPMLEKLAKRLNHDLSDPSSWEQVGAELKKLSSRKATAVSQ